MITEKDVEAIKSICKSYKLELKQIRLGQWMVSKGEREIVFWGNRKMIKLDKTVCGLGYMNENIINELQKLIG